MPQRVDVPGMGVVEFPDGMSDEQISAAIKKNMSAKSEVEPSVAGDMAKTAPSALVRGVTGLVGLPGTIRELGEAGARKALSWIGEKAGVTPEQATGAFDEAMAKKPRVMPTPDEINQGVGAITGPLYEPKTRPGRYANTAIEMAPGALGGPGGVLPKIAKYAVTPGVVSERAGEAAEGTGYEPYARVAGALLGVGAGAGAGKAASGIQNFAAARSASRDVADVLGTEAAPAGAVRRVAGSLSEDAVTARGAAARASELGPNETMVMDLGRQLGGRAEAIASQPGKGQNTVLDAVEGRTGSFGAATADRVRQTLDQEMGQSHNVVDLKDRVAQIVDTHAAPVYKRVMEAHPVVSIPASIAERPAVARAMKDAVELAKNYGEKLQETTRTTVLSGPGYHIADDVVNPAKTSLRYWDYVKKSLDQRINGYYKSGGTSELASAEKADLGGLLDARKQLVDHLDTVTKGEYKLARQIAANKPQLNEALEFGQAAFNSRLLPEEFASELSQMSLPQQAMAKAGFRRELDRLIESSRNEGATARRVLDTNSVLQKTEALFGPQAAREIERRIGAETVFQDTTQKIAQNSRTAVRRELIKDTATPSTADIGSVTVPGAVAMAGRGGLNYIRDQGMSRTREGIGNILTASGDKRDQIVDLLLNYNQKRAANSLQSGSAKRSAVVDALIAAQQGQ